jgi:hypothetical protein
MEYKIGQILIGGSPFNSFDVLRVCEVGEKIGVEIPVLDGWEFYAQLSRSSLEGFDVYAPVKATLETSAHQSNS